MKEKEAQLAAEVAELLRRAEEVDEDEDRRYGRDKRGDELPEELSFPEGRLRKIREAKAALEAEAKAAAEQAESEGRNHPRVPGDKTQRNFTDPDSRIMPGPGGRDFQQSYNCQAVEATEWGRRRNVPQPRTESPCETSGPHPPFPANVYTPTSGSGQAVAGNETQPGPKTINKGPVFPRPDERPPQLHCGQC